MHRESVQRSRAERPIVVGDRLDTDIEGAAAVGCPSLLVLTGVTTAGASCCAAVPLQRPDYLARRPARAARRATRRPTSTRSRRACRGWTAALDSGRLRLSAAER